MHKHGPYLPALNQCVFPGSPHIVACISRRPSSPTDNSTKTSQRLDVTLHNQYLTAAPHTITLSRGQSARTITKNRFIPNKLIFSMLWWRRQSLPPSSPAKIYAPSLTTYPYPTQLLHQLRATRTEKYPYPCAYAILWPQDR